MRISATCANCATSGTHFTMTVTQPEIVLARCVDTKILFQFDIGLTAVTDNLGFQ